MYFPLHVETLTWWRLVALKFSVSVAMFHCFWLSKLEAGKSYFPIWEKFVVILVLMWGFLIWIFFSEKLLLKNVLRIKIKVMEIVEFPWFSFFWWIFSVSIKPVVPWAYATPAVWPNSGSPVLLPIASPTEAPAFPPCRVQEQGRLRAGGERLPNVTVLSLQPLLFMDLLDERTLVAVERPLDDIIAQLPPPIKKKKFGT